MTARCSFIVAVSMLISLHQSPAPIVEESTPQPSAGTHPERTPAGKAKRKTDDSHNGKTTPLDVFEGIWSGTVTSTATATFLFSTSGSSSTALTIRVSKTGVVTYANQQPVQGWLSADGKTLNWNVEIKIDETMTWRQSCSLKLTGPKSAFYSDHGRLDGGIAGSSGNSTGMLYRR